MEFYTIASSSAGNAALVCHEDTHILIDAGVSCRRITQSLAALDLTLEDIAAILITHEHVDHVRALGTLQKKCAVPLYANDRRLYPVYEMCQAHGVPVILMLGGRAGPDVSYSNPEIISRIAADFPRGRFMASHGGWPWVQAVIGACFWQENIWLCPDMYLMNNSGAQDYVAAANTWLRDRFLFGSAYPLMPIGESLAIFKSLFREDVLPRLLWKNASELFNIQLPQEETSC